MKRVFAIAAVAVFASGCSYIGLPGFGGGQSYPQQGYGQYGQQQQAPAMPHSPRRAYPTRSGSPFSASLEYGFEGKSSSEFHGGVFIADVANIEERDWNDSHETAHRVALRGNYAPNSKTEFSAGISYTQADSAGPILVGNAGVAGAGNAPLTAEFEDYKKLGLEVGARRYLGQTGGLRSPVLRPFVGANVGIARVDEINAQFVSTGFPSIPLTPALTDTVNAGFYDESWVPTGDLNAGVQVKFNRFASIELETGVRYDGGLDENDDTLAVLGIESINDNSSRVTVPVTLRGRINF